MQTRNSHNDPMHSDGFAQKWRQFLVKKNWMKPTKRLISSEHNLQINLIKMNNFVCQFICSLPKPDFISLFFIYYFEDLNENDNFPRLWLDQSCSNLFPVYIIFAQWIYFYTFRRWHDSIVQWLMAIVLFISASILWLPSARTSCPVDQCWSFETGM